MFSKNEKWALLHCFFLKKKNCLPCRKLLPVDFVAILFLSLYLNDLLSCKVDSNDSYNQFEKSTK